MRNQGGHITGKVLAGYILLVALAVCSVGYIYNIVKTIVEEDVSPDSLSREKVYLITNTLSLMYESEAMGQFIGIEQDQYYRFNRTLNRVHARGDGPVYRDRAGPVLPFQPYLEQGTRQYGFVAGPDL